MPFSAFAQIVPSGAHAPGVTNTANGLPQVNLTKPSAAGVSLNTYSQFDVQKPGAVLNNSPTVTGTQLAGQINGNPNYAAGDAARVIVNQVNSNNPSLLRGYVEVAGSKADVVISNSSGLVVDGGGFINTARGVLTTGNPVFDPNGNLTGFSVTGGNIAVQGDGLNASNVDQVDLISRAVQVNAKIYGNTLNVVTGANNVDYATLTATPIAGDGTAPPGVSIDVSQLGGMYANRITLTGTEKGVGVANAGEIAAQAGDLTLTASGRLVQSGQMAATGNININAASGVDNTGTVYAQQTSTVNTAGTLNNNGGKLVGSALSVQAGGLANRGGTLGAQSSATLGVASLDNSAGGQISAQNLSITDTGALGNAGGSIQANGTLNVGAQTVANDGGRLVNGGPGTTTITATNGVTNTAGGLIGSNGDLSLSAQGVLSNTGGSIQANGALNVGAQAVANDGGRIVNSGTGASAVVATNGVTNTAGGLIGGNGNVSVSAQGALSNTGGSIQANGALNASVQTVANDGGRIVNGGTGATTVAATGGVTNTASGLIGGNGDVSVSAQGALSNTGGSIQANGALNASAQTIANDGGRIVNGGTGATTVAATGGVTNTAGGLIGGNGDVSLSTQGLLTNTGGSIQANKALNISAQSIANDGGSIINGGTDATTITALNRLTNANGGLIHGNTALALSGAALINDSGKIESGQDVSMTAASMSNTGGAVNANRNIAFTGALSSGGAMTAGHDLTLSLSGDFTNVAANTLHADNNFTLGVGGSLTNSGQLMAGNALTVNAGNVVNAAGANMNSAATTVNAAGSILNAGLIEGDSVATRSASLNNTGAIIGNNVSVTAADVNNTGAQALVAGATSVGIYAANSLTNADGALIYSAGNMELARDNTRDATGLLANQTGTITNSAATIEAAGNLDIAAHTLNNLRTGVQTQAGTPVTTTGSTLTLWTRGGFTSAYVGELYLPWNYQDSGLGTAVVKGLITPLVVTLPATQVVNVNPANQTFSLTAPLVDFQTTGPTGDSGVTGVNTWTIAKNPTQHYLNLTPNADGTVTITFYPDFDPATNIQPDQVRLRYDLGPDSHDYVEMSRTSSITTTTDQLLNAGTAAMMRAQGTIRVNADGGAINNSSSTMAAGGDLIRRATGGTVNDTGIQLLQTTTQTDTSVFSWFAKTSGDTDTQTVVDGTVPLSTTTVASLAAIATSNQTVQTNAQNITIGSVGLSGQTVSGSNQQTVTGAGLHPQTLGSPGIAIPGLTLPSNALFSYHPASGSGPLIETDPRFTSYKTFISSDYMLQQLGLNPQSTAKRLGDGFYEEQLVMNQVTQLTGHTFLGSYTNNLDEYTALMNGGAQYAQQFGLNVGVGLTPAQMSQLTTNIVWLVNQTVTLPDGTQQTVLVPQLYLAQSNAVDLQSNGVLVAGNQVNLNATGDISNSGKIASNTATTVIGNNIVNLGTITSQGTTTVAAVQDLSNLGGLISGTDTTVAAGRDLINKSTTAQASVNIANGGFDASASGMGVQSVGTISGTNSVTLAAGRDVTIAGAAVKSDGDVAISAGRNLTVDTLALNSTQDAGTVDGVNGGHASQTLNVGSAITAGGNLHTVSGGNTSLTDATVQAGGDASLVSMGDLTVTAAKNTSAYNGQSMGGSIAHHQDSTYDESVQGSNLNAGGNLTLAAGQGNAGNLSILGSSVTTGGAIGAEGGKVTLLSTGDITVGTVAEQHDAQHWSQTNSSGFLSHSQTTSASTLHETDAIGSLVSGDAVTTQSGKDLTILGSNVVGTKDVNLAAAGNVTIGAATNTLDQTSFEETRKSGLMGSGGIGFTVGASKQSEDDRSSSTTASASTVGSVTGNVTITADKQYNQIGSNVLASQGDIAIQAKQVNIVEARENSFSSQESKYEQSGFTLAFSAPVLAALQTVGQMAEAASKTSDSRMQALAAGASALTLYNNAGAFNSLGNLANGGSMKDAGQGASISLTWGTSHSDSLSTQTSNTGVGSTVSAGGNVSIVATGAGQDSNLLIQGSDVTAGGNVRLKADNAVSLLASQNTTSERSHNDSSSASFGVAVSVSSNGGPAFGVTASASLGSGHSNGDDLSNTNTHVTAGKTLTIESGGDTTLQGAVVSGKQVAATVGGNLNLESLQDTSVYDSKQQNIGGSVTVGYGFSASLSYSDSKVNGDYASVAEQTGIKAGDGGFQVNVKGNTDLKGAVIASNQSAIDQGKNSLVTGTLTTSDIANHSNYDATGMSLSGGFSVGPSDSKKTGTASNTANNGTTWSVANFGTKSQGAGFGYSSESGNESSTTLSGISGGSITITNGAGQQAKTGQTATEAVASVNRDVTSDSGSNGLTKTWNGQQLQQEVAANAQIIATFGQQASTAIGDYAAQQIKKADALRAEAANDPEHAAELNAQADELEAKWGASGTLRIAAHALVGALTGGVDGAAGATVSTLAAPQVTQLLSDAGITGPLADTLTALASTAAGAAVGGTAGAAAATNEVINNCLNHPENCVQDDLKKEVEKELAREKAALGEGKAIVGYDANGEPLTALDPTGLFVGLFGRSGGATNTSKPDFYVMPNGTAVPATGYRGVGGDKNIAEATSGVIASRNPTYITFDNIEGMSGQQVKDLLQLRQVPTYGVSFDTLQLIPNLSIPGGRWNTLPTPEPFTSTYPEWGTGGGTQAITNKPISIDKLFPLGGQK